MNESWPSSNFSSIQLLGLFDTVTGTFDNKEFSIHCCAMFKAAVTLSRQYNITIGKGITIGWQTIETDELIHLLSNVCMAISITEVIGIVGPVYSRQTDVIVALADKIGIPVISYSATDSKLSNRIAYPMFYRAAPPDDIAAISISQLFIRFNWTSCSVIHQNDDYGFSGARAIKRIFKISGLNVSRFLRFDIDSQSMQENLKDSLSNSSARIVILWAESRYASIIVQSALELDVIGPLFTWILSTTIPLTSFSPTFYPKLAGMLTIEPTTANILNEPFNQTLLNDAYRIWQQYEPQSFPGAANVNTYALFAFDAAWAFIQVLTDYCSSSTSNASSSCIEFIRSSNCFDVRFLNSTSLFNRMNNISFLGVSGLVQFSSDVTNRIGGIYYLVKNVQRTLDTVNYIPVLRWSPTKKWTEVQQSSRIVWPGNSLEPPSGRASLRGIRLRIGIIESIPFTIVSSMLDDQGQQRRKYVGYAPDLINLLQQKLQFIPTLILAPPNQTYSGLVDAVANGTYDIVVGDVTITAARRKVGSFSDSIFDNSLRIIMRNKMINNIDFIAFLAPFSLNLWMILCVTTIFAAFLVCLLERLENETLRHRSFISAITMSWWYSISTIMGYGADFDVTTAAGRLLTVGLYLLSLVLVATYTANLASDLTISKSKFMISGIDDLKKGKIPYSRIGIRVGTAGEGYYLREISGGVRNFYPLASRQHMYDCLLQNLIDVSFMDSGTAEYVTNNIYCNLTLVGGDFDKSTLAIVIPHHWLYEEDLDISLLSLRETGILDTLKQKWFELSSCPSTSGTSTSMAMETMSGLFLTFLGICVLSIFLFMWTKRFAVKSYVVGLLSRCCPSLQQTKLSVENSSARHFKNKNRSQVVSPPAMSF